MHFSNNKAWADGGAVAIAYEYVEFLPKEATYSGNVNLGVSTRSHVLPVKLGIAYSHNVMPIILLSLTPSQAALRFAPGGYGTEARVGVSTRLVTCSCFLLATHVSLLNYILDWRAYYSRDGTKQPPCTIWSVSRQKKAWFERSVTGERGCSAGIVLRQDDPHTGPLDVQSR